MKKILTITGLLLILLFSAGTSNKAYAEAYVSFDLFYQSLDPYGGWIDHGQYGYVWTPAGVGPQWQPYSDGRWEYSDRGWIWVSYEPWGWATYHYGRWVFDDYYGWVWIPGVEWAPSYVSWYDSPGYVGWAPQAPDNYFFIEIGLFFGSNNYYYGDPYYYDDHYYHKKHHYKHNYGHNYYAPSDHVVFVPERHFHHKNAKLVRLNSDHVDHSVVYRNVKNVNKTKVYNEKYSRHGPDRGHIENKTGRKFKRLQIQDKHSTVHRGKVSRNIVKNDKYQAYRPKFDYKKSESKQFNRTNAKIDNKRNNSVKNDYTVKHKQSKNNERSYKNEYKNKNVNKKSNTQAVKQKTYTERYNGKEQYSARDKHYSNDYKQNKNKSYNPKRSSEYPYPKNNANKSYNKKQNNNYKPDSKNRSQPKFENRAKNKVKQVKQKPYNNERNTTNYKARNNSNKSYAQTQAKTYQNKQKTYSQNKNQNKSKPDYSQSRSNNQKNYSKSSNQQKSYNQNSYKQKSYNNSYSKQSFNKNKSFSKR